MDNDRSQARGDAPPREADARTLGQILARSPFAGLAGPSREALLGISTLARMPRRHPIAAQGEPAHSFLLIGSGRVKVERQHAAHVLLLGHRGPGQMVGETALAGAPAATESASVVDPTEALSIPVAALRRQLGADAPLRAALAAAILEQHRELEERLASLLFHGVEARLAGLLLDAGQRWGTPHADGVLVSAPFTHAEMAHLIGSTRETVTLILGRLRREGLLTFERRHVVLRDRERLGQRASAPPA